MKEFLVTCPCCQQQLKIMLSETDGDKIAVSFFDISDNSETIEIIRQKGYEFGASLKKGGKDNEI